MEAENFITATGYVSTTAFIELKWCSKMIMVLLMNILTRTLDIHSGCKLTL